jgi:ketosteroid isomerase-like protein
MEASNVELCGLTVAAVNAREVPKEILAEDFLMENRVSAVTDYSYHGAVGWREWMSDLFEEFAAGARYSLDELIAVGEDFVAAMFSVAGHGALSGEPLELRWAGVTWFRDGKATRAIGYASRSEALEALGLHG